MCLAKYIMCVQKIYLKANKNDKKLKIKRFHYKFLISDFLKPMYTYLKGIQSLPNPNFLLPSFLQPNDVNL